MREMLEICTARKFLRLQYIMGNRYSGRPQINSLKYCEGIPSPLNRKYYVQRENRFHHSRKKHNNHKNANLNPLEIACFLKFAKIFTRENL